MRFAIPIYGGQVLRCLTPEAMNRACKRLGLDPPDGLTRGLCAQADGSDGSVVYLIGWYDRNPGSLVHECVHCGMFVLQRAGIDPTGDAGEALAYLTDYLFMRLKTR